MISPVMFKLFGLEIRWYSVLILLGVVISYFLINGESNRFKFKKEFVFNLMFWTIIFGILGARLYYVIFNFSYYSHHFTEIFKIWNGGLAIHGAMIAVLLTIIIYCHKYQVNTVKVLDICVPALLISQAIGRWGNLLNQEAFGSVVTYQTLAKMKFIPQFVIDNMYIDGNYHLPMFYFESILCLVGFILLLFLRRRKYIKNGQILATYLMWYGALRFFIEMFRTDSLMLFNIKVAQLVSVVMIIFGFYLIAVQARKPKLDELYNAFDEEVKY